MIKTCNCSHRFQDARYGENKRVCNEKKDGGWRCTVCGRDIVTVTKK